MIYISSFYISENNMSVKVIVNPSVAYLGFQKWEAIFLPLCTLQSLYLPLPLRIRSRPF